MSVSLSNLAGAGWQFFTDSGTPLSGGLLYTYAAGTTTPQTTYTSGTGATPNSNPIVLNSAGRVPNQIWTTDGLSYKLVLQTSLAVQIFSQDNISGTDDFTGPFATLAASGGSNLIGFIQTGTGAVATTLQVKVRQTVSAFDYMTSAQITAVQSYAFTTPVTAALQAALNAARVMRADLFIPAGGYLVTGLTIPGDVSGAVDDRDSAIRIYGQGFGEPFVTALTGGTIIKSVTDAPVIKDILGTNPSSNGTIEIDHIRFDGTSTTAVVLLESFYGLSSMHNCAVFQRGVGDGVKVTYAAGVWIYMVWALNKDWAASGLGAARTGIGFNFPITYDGGLVTVSKCSARGWLTAYTLGGGAGVMYSPTIEQSECSVVYNGIILSGTSKAIIDSNYFEGLEAGKGITNSGTYSVITNNLIFSGTSFGIDSRLALNKGSVIKGNTIALGSVVSAQGIALAGAFGQDVSGNSISCTDGTASQIGIFVDVAGKIDIHANAFDPKETWTGASASKVDYTSTCLIQGIITGQSNNVDFPILSQGAVSLAYAPLTGANVAANVLTVPDGGYFVVTAAAPVTVNSLDAGIIPYREITFRTTNANMTFADTAQIFLSAAFTGPGTISFVVERTGGLSYAYETSRTVF
jgi:hypothetical protein